MKDKTITTLVAIPTLGAMAIANLAFNGPDGAVLTTVAALIAGLGGFAVGRKTG